MFDIEGMGLNIEFFKKLTYPFILLAYLKSSDLKKSCLKIKLILINFLTF